MLTDNDNITHPQRAAPDEDRRERTAPLVELGFDHAAFGGAVRIGFQFEQFGLKLDFLDQRIETGFLECGDFDILHIARHFLDDDFILQQRLAHFLRIGFGLVTFGDRDDHRHARCLGMVDRFDRLRLDAVIGGHDQHDDVGDVRAALAHVDKGFVARRVEERDLCPVLHRHLIGADMLGDPARFTAHDIGPAQGIEQRGLAMIDMAHDRDDRGPRHERVFGIDVVCHIDVDIAFGHARDIVAEVGDEQLCRILIDAVTHRRGHAHLEQRLDQVAAAFGHAVGEFADRDGFGDDDIADLLGLNLPAAMRAAFLFAGTLERGERPCPRAFAIAVERARNGELARLATVVTHFTARRAHGFGAAFGHGRRTREVFGVGPTGLCLLDFGFDDRRGIERC